MIGDVVDVDRICAEAKAQHQNEPLDYIIIDHITIINESGRGNTTEKITSVSAKLKHLSKVLNIPVIALAQLDGKGIAKRPDKRPNLGDVSWAFAIVQDASRVIFLYRPEFYGIEEMADGTPSTNRAEIIFAKQQEDDIGCCVVGFDGVRGFYDLEVPEFQPTQFPKSGGYQPMPVERVEHEDMPF